MATVTPSSHTAAEWATPLSSGQRAAFRHGSMSSSDGQAWHGGTGARGHGGTVARWHGGTVARWHGSVMAAHVAHDGKGVHHDTRDDDDTRQYPARPRNSRAPASRPRPGSSRSRAAGDAGRAARTRPCAP